MVFNDPAYELQIYAAEIANEELSQILFVRKLLLVFSRAHRVIKDAKLRLRKLDSNDDNTVTVLRAFINV